MPKKPSYLYRPTHGVGDDLQALMNEFMRLKTVRFSEFSNIWRLKKMSFLCAGRYSARETREFIERTMMMAIEFFMPPYQFQVRAGGLYLLYALFETQPITPRVKIRLTQVQWKDTMHFQQEAAQQTHLDVVYIFQKLIQDHAFHLTFTTSDMSSRNNPPDAEAIGHNLMEDMTDDRRDIDNLFNYEAMEQLSYLLDHYQQMKVNLAGPEASKPDKSLDVVQGTMVEDLVTLLQSFKTAVGNIRQHGRPVDKAKTSNSEDAKTNKETNESTGSRMQAIKDRAFTQMTKSSGRSNFIIEMENECPPSSSSSPSSSSPSKGLPGNSDPLAVTKTERTEGEDPNEDVANTEREKELGEHRETKGGHKSKQGQGSQDDLVFPHGGSVMDIEDPDDPEQICVEVYSISEKGTKNRKCSLGKSLPIEGGQSSQFPPFEYCFGGRGMKVHLKGDHHPAITNIPIVVTDPPLNLTRPREDKEAAKTSRGKGKSTKSFSLSKYKASSHPLEEQKSLTHKDNISDISESMPHVDGNSPIKRKSKYLVQGITELESGQEEKNMDNLSSTSFGKEIKKHSKVGRPRKNLPETDQKKHSKAGRPRKNLPETDQKKQSKVGRPRKNLPEADQKKQSKVGRPRKNLPETVEKPLKVKAQIPNRRPMFRPKAFTSSGTVTEIVAYKEVNKPTVFTNDTWIETPHLAAVKTSQTLHVPPKPGKVVYIVKGNNSAKAQKMLDSVKQSNCKISDVKVLNGALNVQDTSGMKESGAQKKGNSIAQTIGKVYSKMPVPSTAFSISNRNSNSPSKKRKMENKAASSESSPKKSKPAPSSVKYGAKFL